MIKSQNTRVDLAIDATNLNAFTSNGKIMVGDKAFEYYNNRNKNDFIQIPWTEIKLITALVIFGKRINRFAIHTKNNGDFIFASRDNKKTLRAISKYIASDKLRKSKTVLDYLKEAIKKH